MTDKEWIVTVIDDGPGTVTLGVYEKHLVGDPGTIIKKPLSLFEMERLHAALTKAMWYNIRSGMVIPVDFEAKKRL